MKNIGEIIWQPSIDRMQQSEMTRYISFLEANDLGQFSGWNALHQWSVQDRESFWDSVAKFTKVKWLQAPSKVCIPAPEGKMLGARWFEGGKLNFAHNLLLDNSEREVLISYREGYPRRGLTGIELRNRVAVFASYLRSVGVKKFDRVAGVLANSEEAVIAMLATASLGAIWSSSSPDFGVEGIIDRFGQIDPSVIIFTASYQYNGKKYETFDTIAEVKTQLKHSVRYVATDTTDQSGFWDCWDKILNEKSCSESPELEFEPVSFDHPLYIMFSSGTTGIPKCIIHGVGGTLLQHKKELSLHTDLKPGEKLLYFTTCGWMMWNWMISALSVGASVVTFDGSIGYPDLKILWKIVADEKVSVLGTSPKFLSTCEKNGISPGKNMDFTHLKSILSTGSPLLPENFEWVYRDVKSDLSLASIAGGTDIISCFVLGNPLLPIRLGEIQAPGLGMDVDSWDQEGRSIRGEKGELVCKSSFVSMPIGFWGDYEDTKYRNAYFNYYDDQEVWRHGDFIELTESGGVIIYGRSDATLNPGGVRIGTAEIYRQVENLDEVLDSLAVGYQEDGDVSVVLFVKLKENWDLDAGLAQGIKKMIRENLTPRHVPKYLFRVKDIPYTRSGKKVEMAVSGILRGQEVKNETAIANPECLSEYQEIKKNLDGH